MLSIIHYQRNENQNYDEISHHTRQNGHNKKNAETLSAAEDVD